MLKISKLCKNIKNNGGKVRNTVLTPLLFVAVQQFNATWKTRS